eukprot:m.272978 g.272978  ORF g.272978 m.272978 type:complete len:183 (-) comp16276_c0_seq41:2630-3178(-)
MPKKVFYTNVLEGKMEGYRRFHDNIWPEVAAGLRAAGVTQLQIYNLPGTNTLCMTIETAGNIDLGKATGPGSRYRLDPRCKEWEEMMDSDFHGGWTEMQEIHSSTKQWNTSLGLPMLAPTGDDFEERPTSPPSRINVSTIHQGTMRNENARYEGAVNERPQSPRTGRRGYHPPGSHSQIKFG